MASKYASGGGFRRRRLKKERDRLGAVTGVNATRSGSADNMRMVVLLGFLGSGKTTLLLEMSRYLVARGRRVAIIVNEAGQVPIDGTVLGTSTSSDRVREIFGGCFCCQLAGNLLQSLNEVRRDLEVDRVFLEPSGVADPGQIKSLVETAGIPTRHLALLDLERIDFLREVITPLVHNTIQTADLVLLNKADLVSPEVVRETESYVHEVRPGVPVRVTSTLNVLDRALMEEVLAEWA